MLIWCALVFSVLAFGISFFTLWESYRSMCEIIGILDAHIDAIAELEKRRDANFGMRSDE